MTSTGVVNVVAVFTPLEGHRDEVMAALEVAIPLVHDEPGCELYVITEADDGRLVMIEKWSSGEQLDAHGTSEAVAELAKSLDGHLAQPVEVIRLTPHPIGDAVKGAL